MQAELEWVFSFPSYRHQEALGGGGGGGGGGQFPDFISAVMNKIIAGCAAIEGYAVIEGYDVIVFFYA